MNSLTVQRFPRASSPESAHDQSIALALRDRFQQCPYLAVRRLVCDFREGVAILRGTVPTYFTRQVAIMLAHDVDGVRVLDDRIDVSPSEKKAT